MITSLVSNDRRERGTVSSHVQWIEKALGEYEVFKINDRKAHPTKNITKTEPVPCFAYSLQGMFPYVELPVNRNDIGYPCGCHAPLPNLSVRSKHFLNSDRFLLRPLLHYVNYFYPVMVDPNIGRGAVSELTGKTGLTVPQKVAIGRVNNWIKTRYNVHVFNDAFICTCTCI